MKRKKHESSLLDVVNASESLASACEDKVEIRKGPEGLSLTNAYLTKFGGIKCRGWKTLRGFIRILKQQNKLCKKCGVKVKYEIILPIPT